jgi:hypothetical protein
MGTSALVENSARTKARCAAVMFNVEKPDKFAIRFYCVVSTSQTYIHSMMDNRSGNRTEQTAPEAYCQLFHSYERHTTTALQIAPIQK